MQLDPLHPIPHAARTVLWDLISIAAAASGSLPAKSEGGSGFGAGAHIDPLLAASAYNLVRIKEAFHASRGKILATFALESRAEAAPAARNGIKHQLVAAVLLR